MHFEEALPIIYFEIFQWMFMEQICFLSLLFYNRFSRIKNLQTQTESGVIKTVKD